LRPIRAFLIDSACAQRVSGALCKNFFHGDTNDTRRFCLTLENCDTRCDCAECARDPENLGREKTIYHMHLLAITRVDARVRQRARNIATTESVADLLCCEASDSVRAYTRH
jgi:hypothetical protein